MKGGNRDGDLNKYQKEVLLKDATKVFLRTMIAEDIDALNEFFKAVPKNELRYLREDVTNISVVRSWADTLDYKRVLPVSGAEKWQDHWRCHFTSSGIRLEWHVVWYGSLYTKISEELASGI